MDTSTALSKEQLLAHYKQTSPKELIHLYEGLRDKLDNLVDISENSSALFKPEYAPLVESYMEQVYGAAIEGIDYGDQTQLVENFSDDSGNSNQILPISEVHMGNMKQMLRNSVTESRIANPNQLNLNQLTPFDAFLPFTIVRSYLPLIAKDLMPTQTPEQPFIRIKQMYKYIVTKDNTRYLRPDVYNDPTKMKEILNSAKGREVTQEWYPAVAENAAATDYDSVTITVPAPTEQSPDATKEEELKLPKVLAVKNLDVLQESGGLLNIGDALDIDVCVNGIRAIVKASDGTVTLVEQTGYFAYPDLTSITPQRSVSFNVKIPVKNSEGKIESVVEDRIMGDFNASTNSFVLTSVYGYVRQVQFGGHMSNKNGYEYLSFTHDYNVTQHPIPEGYSSNVPITIQDMQLYNETASIDIVATAVNEMTEIFTQAEDADTLYKINEERDRWMGKGPDEHPFEHMFGPVAFESKVDVALGNDGRFMKRYTFVQDEINYKIRALIGQMRDTLVAEPFRVVAFAHPNLASLFVGTDVDWKITPGMAGTEGVRMDYKMGIYTSQGDSFRLLTSQKIKEEEGLRFLIFPVNETNFLSWKHFAHSIYFSRDYRNPEMHLVPAIMSYAKFYTHSYTPLQVVLKIENYK